MPFDTLFFDLDGTLSDPKLGIVGSIQYAMREMDRPVPAAADLVWCIGPALRGSFKVLLGSDDDDLAEEALRHYRQRFSEQGWMFKNSLYPGISDLLPGLQEDGWRLYVVTAKPQVYADEIIEHFALGHCFEKVYGPDLDGRLGNKNDLLAHVLAAEQIDPARGIMIGDRRHDIEAAQVSGVYSIAVTYGYGSVAELSAAEPDRILNDVAALRPLLKTLQSVSSASKDRTPI